MDNSLQDCTELPTGDMSDTEIVQDYKKLSKRNQANTKVRHNAYCGATYPHLRVAIYGVSQEECARLREGVPYVKVYRYNPKHVCPKLNSYGDNGQRKVWSSGGSTHCICQLTA